MYYFDEKITINNKRKRERDLLYCYIMLVCKYVARHWTDEIAYTHTHTQRHEITGNN